MAGANSRDVITYVPLHSSQREVMNIILGRGPIPPPKRVQLRAGRRWGKSTLLEQIGCSRASRGKRVGWFVPEHKLWTPSYKRILKTIRPLVESSNKTEALIETQTGGCVEFWTLENEDAGRSRLYDLVILDEVSLKKKGMREVWEQSIKPTLLDRNGDAISAGTPKGIDPDNFYYAVSEDATDLFRPDGVGLVHEDRRPKLLKSEFGFVEFHVPTAQNPHLDAEAVAKLQEENSPLVYLQEFLAQFVDWRGVAFFPEPKLLGQDGKPVPAPQRCDEVFVTIDTAIKTGKENDGTAAVFWGRQRVGTPLFVLDWDIIQIEGGSLETWLPGVFQRGEELARKHGARRGFIGAWIEDKGSGTILLQQARKRNWPAYEIDSVLTSMGKDERAISVSAYVHQEKVKITPDAYAKSVIYKQQARNHFISQVCGFRIGEKDPKAADDLLDSFTYGIAVALGDGAGF